MKAKKSKKNNVKASTLKQVLHYVKSYRLLLALSIIFSTVSVALTLYIPIIIGKAIDLIIGKDNVMLDAVLELLVNAGIIALIIGILQWIINNINNKITYNVIKKVRDEAFEKIEKLPLKYIDSNSYGETVNKVINDVDQFADGLLMGFTQFFTGIVTILGTLVFMLTISIKITAIVVVLTPLSLFVASFIAKNTYKLFHTQSKTRAEQTALIDEMISNQKVVKAFAHEDEAMEEFDEINNRLQKCSVKAIFFSSLVNPTTRFINSLVYTAVALFGAFIVINNGEAVLSIGALSCILSYATQYAKPFNEISGIISELQNALACASRIFEFINEDSEIPEKSDAIVLNDAQGNIDIENVSFSYTEEQRLIENFNLKAKKGQRIAIVGPTGCGKTTFINLLMRFYDVNSGSISVDGNDIRDMTRNSLRKSYGMVLQDTWIRNGTVKENIAIGMPDATNEEIIAAAKSSHAHSFIKRLPNGYDTVLTENGSILSQGQKQLLCIARIMLCLPPMLILDEATSSIDTRTEIKIQEAFAKLMKGRTSFIVAHRLSTIREADLILVMNNGQIIEQGTHDSLLDKKGFYYKLYNSQFESI
ncbi:MAG: ABC transporter ATP-binding protein [Clostridia bacterium]|nr:ABC transporter ATP-binding protein [Clostridia bacterium]